MQCERVNYLGTVYSLTCNLYNGAIWLWHAPRHCIQQLKACSVRGRITLALSTVCTTAKLGTSSAQNAIHRHDKHYGCQCRKAQHCWHTYNCLGLVGLQMANEVPPDIMRQLRSFFNNFLPAKTVSHWHHIDTLVSCHAAKCV